MKMIIIVDMLNDFIEPTGKLYCGEQARAIIPQIKERLERARQDGDMVVFLQDNHGPFDLEFNRFPPHCIIGTSGAEIIDELRPNPDELVIPKMRYNGFYNTDLDDLMPLIVREVVVVGVCTNICVMDTVGELANRDMVVTVPRDCVADFDSEAHEFALKRMQSIYGAKVI